MFFAFVKKQCGEKKVPIGRVSEPLNAAMSEKAAAVVTALSSKFAADEDPEILKQFVIGPVLPEAFTSQQLCVAALRPAWWATGPHHMTTNTEPHKYGSIRASICGSRSIAATDFSKWVTFLRTQHAAAGKGKGKGKDDGEKQEAFLSLGSMQSSVSYQEAKTRFRNLSKDSVCVYAFVVCVCVCHCLQVPVFYSRASTDAG